MVKLKRDTTMATIKSYTDIEQSKKLAEILTIESADMYWDYDVQKHEDYPMVMDEQFDDTCIRAWSLAALLDILPKHIKQNDGRIYKFHIFNDDGIVIKRWGCSYCAEDFHNRAEYLSDPHLKYPTNVYSDKYEDPVDACYEMILKLHGLNLL